MNNPTRSTVRHLQFCSLFFLAALAGCQSTYIPSENGSGREKLTVSQARTIVENGFLQDSPRWVIAAENTSNSPVSPLFDYTRATKVRITPRNVQIVAGPDRSLVIPLERISIHFADSMGPPCFLSFGNAVKEFSLVLGGSGCLDRGKPFVDSLATLRDAALAGYLPPTQEQQARFAQVAVDYRAASPKPSLPEAARAQQVQAEGAVRDKEFDEADEHFGQALEIAPWWPEGHFNRALVLAELGSFAAAIVEMQHYLALVPNAPNARAAQDMIYDWQRKAP